MTSEKSKYPPLTPEEKRKTCGMSMRGTQHKKGELG